MFSSMTLQVHADERSTLSGLYLTCSKETNVTLTVFSSPGTPTCSSSSLVVPRSVPRSFRTGAACCGGVVSRWRPRRASKSWHSGSACIRSAGGRGGKCGGMMTNAGRNAVGCSESISKSAGPPYPSSSLDDDNDLSSSSPIPLCADLPHNNRRPMNPAP